jgi:hypothetical protein
VTALPPANLPVLVELPGGKATHGYFGTGAGKFNTREVPIGVELAQLREREDSAQPFCLCYAHDLWSRDGRFATPSPYRYPNDKGCLGWSGWPYAIGRRVFVSDIFTEVDEEVRREQLKKLWERYSNLIIGAAILVVAAVGAWRGYEYWQARKAAEAGAAYEAALKLS